ncbi:MAG: hypoxanthine phosphoribosyltransferase [Waddliaceae bacterium]|nr:hypoxanthine phosphoribosyltransferase [Waddliaceae bacterium]
MSESQVLNHDIEFEQLISDEEIQGRVAAIAAAIDERYGGQELIVVMIMKGAICFVADLIRAINTDFSLEYLRCSSYGKSGTQRGELKISGLEDLEIEGKHVLLVDDICDSGHTLKAVSEAIEKKNSASIASVVLLSRKVKRPVNYEPDFTLFSIEQDDFVVGYGLDYKEKYRGLPGVYTVKGNWS